MNTTHPGFSEEELHAFIDCELDPQRAAQIRRLAESDPALGHRIAAFRSDKQRLLETFGHISDLPLPPHWLRIIESRARPIHSVQQRKHVAPQLLAAIAAALLLLIGGSLSVLFPSYASRDDVAISEALAARDNVLHAEQTFGEATLQQATRRDLVLSNALAMRIKAPELERMGYRLDSMRTFSRVPGGTAVELDYRNSQNMLFTLYLRRPLSPPRVDIVEREGVRICLWQDDVISAVMTGKMSAGEMARLASLAYSGLFL
jgi:anti-sigma factor RsiW